MKTSSTFFDTSSEELNPEKYERGVNSTLGLYIDSFEGNMELRTLLNHNTLEKHIFIQENFNGDIKTPN